MDLRTCFQPDSAELRGISLCAGYAGLDLGLHIAEPEYRTVAFVERESHAAAALVARMADQALGQAAIWDDLRSFDGRPFRDRVHLVSAGYPCQPFSYAGKRSGDTDPRHLWPEVARIVDEVRPEWVWCENVEGHLSLGFPDVVSSLRSLGYTTKAGLFTAREAGARHRRRRLFILAHADSQRWRLRAGSADRSGEDPAGLASGSIERQRGAVCSQRVDEGLDVALVDAEGGGMVGDIASFRSSPRVRVSFKHGKGSSLRDLTPNPQFYELMMGWPTGWTAPGAPVTAYAAWLRRARGQFSNLLTSWTPEEQTPA